MRSFRLSLVLFAALCPVAVACLSNSNPLHLSDDAGSASSSGGSSGGSSSGGSSSGGSSGGSSSGGSSSGGSSSGGSSGGSSSGSSSGGGDASAGGSCTYTLSGGATGSGSCTAVGAYAANNSITAFGITPTASSPVFGVSVELGTTTAAFQAGTYTAANVLKAEGEYVVIAGTNVSEWYFSAADGGVDGGFTLNLTSTGAEIVTDGGAAWPTPHGTLSLTLNPATGATAPITGTATF